jgi:hypothetical protein
LHFLLFRYSVAAIVLGGLLCALRYRFSAFGLGLTAAIGIASWLFIWALLPRPYGLEPGTVTSFDTALAATGAARGDALDGWLVGSRNPRPAWSLLWYLLAPGDPVRARALLPFLTAVVMVLLPCAVFWLRPKSEDECPWLALTCAFTAVLAASVPLDAFRPFSLFHDGMFFAAPPRALALFFALLSFGLAFRAGPARPVAAGLLLGVAGFVDVVIFCWSLLVLAMTAALDARRRTSMLWVALVPAVALGAPQIQSLLRPDWLRRIPSGAEVGAYRLGFRNAFSVTGDMEWVFVLALLSLPVLWRRGKRADLGILSMLAASYALWLGAAFLYQFHPLSEPALVFHLLRFSVALAAGVGGFELAQRLIARLRESGVLERRGIRGVAPEPLAFALVVILLLPDTAAFLWQPWKLDPLYYSSLQGWSPSVTRLERWVLENTGPDEIVLTGDETGEWIASLTGRRVWSGERLLSSTEARERRRELRRLFLSGRPEVMKEAVEAIGARVIVLDPELRERYWEFDDRQLESSAMFEMVEQIGDRYRIYRAR